MEIEKLVKQYFETNPLKIDLSLTKLSPIIPTRALPILEAMKPVGISYSDLSPSDRGYVLNSVVTIPAYPEVLHH